jgi:hypothetical protein
MLYAILCYAEEKAVGAWTKEEDDACIARLTDVQDRLAAQGKIGPVARLNPTPTARTLKKNATSPLVVDGPFAETKEQLLGFYVVDCADIDEAVEIAQDLARVNPAPGSYEVRPVNLYNPSRLPG